MHTHTSCAHALMLLLLLLLLRSIKPSVPSRLWLKCSVSSVLDVRSQPESVGPCVAVMPSIVLPVAFATAFL